MLYISVLRNESLWEADYEYTSAYRNIVLEISHDKVENYIKETKFASGLQILISLFAHLKLVSRVRLLSGLVLILAVFVAN
jgi:hypothetical protein